MRAVAQNQTVQIQAILNHIVMRILQNQMLIIFNSENINENQNSESKSPLKSRTENVTDKEKSSNSGTQYTNYWNTNWEDQPENVAHSINLESSQSSNINFSTSSIQKHLTEERTTILTYNHPLITSQEKDSQGLNNEISKSCAKYVKKINEWDNNRNEIMISPENYSKQS